VADWGLGPPELPSEWAAVRTGETRRPQPPPRTQCWHFGAFVRPPFKSSGVLPATSLQRSLRSGSNFENPLPVECAGVGLAQPPQKGSRERCLLAFFEVTLGMWLVQENVL
jgi:hypothetical protein